MRWLRRYKDLTLATLILLSLVVLWSLGGWLLPYRFAEGTKPEHGLFGDRFGAINALFSALAFWGILVALYVQWRDLREQRRRLDKQTFETKFFQLLTIHNDIVSAIDLRGRGDAAVLATGRDCFRHFYQRKLAQTFETASAAHPSAGELHQRINTAYMNFFQQNQGDIGHYFRHLYHALEFARVSDVPEKGFYTDLLRAQLSTYEVGLLFYHCLSDTGRGVKPLVEHFALLEHLPRDILFDPRHLELLDPTAFGASRAP